MGLSKGATRGLGEATVREFSPRVSGAGVSEAWVGGFQKTAGVGQGSRPNQGLSSTNRDA